MAMPLVMARLRHAELPPLHHRVEWRNGSPSFVRSLLRWEAWREAWQDIRDHRRGRKLAGPYPPRPVANEASTEFLEENYPLFCRREVMAMEVPVKKTTHG